MSCIFPFWLRYVLPTQPSHIKQRRQATNDVEMGDEDVNSDDEDDVSVASVGSRASTVYSIVKSFTSPHNIMSPNSSINSSGSSLMRSPSRAQMNDVDIGMKYISGYISTTSLTHIFFALVVYYWKVCLFTPLNALYWFSFDVIMFLFILPLHSSTSTFNTLSI